MGTPEFAVESLRALVEGGYNVVAVVTQPDKPVGRHGSVLRAPAVKEYALSVGLPVLQPEKMKDEVFVEQLRGFNADLQVVVAFRMLPEIVWAMPRFGTFNVHASLLPQYRGAAPINWAIINGDTKTGVTTFFLDHEIDTGRIIMQREFDIPDEADVEYVYDGLMKLGSEVCVETVEKILATDGNLPTIEQQSNVELRPAPKIFKETCKIDFANKTVKQIYDFVRGLSPYPGVWTNMQKIDDAGEPVVMKIYKVKKTDEPSSASVGTIETNKNHLLVNTKDKKLEIVELQMPGKKRMQARDFLNGFKEIEKFVLI